MHLHLDASPCCPVVQRCRHPETNLHSGHLGVSFPRSCACTNCSILAVTSAICSSRDGPGATGNVVEEITGLSFEALSKFCNSLLMRLAITSNPLGSVQATMKKVSTRSGSLVEGNSTS